MRDVYERLQKILEKDVDHLADVVPYIGMFQSRAALSRTIQHYEIFREVADRPGAIVELGVFRGESLLTWARLLEMSAMGDRETKVIGFDTFEGFTRIDERDRTQTNQRDDDDFAVRPGRYHAGERAHERLMELVEVFERDHFVPWKPRIEVVEGDIVQTVPAYVAKNPGLRISLLHLDCDLYEPTLVGLQQLYPLVVPGGVVILDEYGQSKFPGESAAFDEYFGAQRPVLRKSRLVSNPSGWFIKPS